MSLIPRHGRPHRGMRLLTACDFWARELGRLGGEAARPVDDPNLAELMRRTVARIERVIETLGRSSSRDNESETATGQATDDLTALAGLPADAESVQGAHLLLRIEAALLRLARDGA